MDEEDPEDQRPQRGRGRGNLGMRGVGSRNRGNRPSRITAAILKDLVEKDPPTILMRLSQPNSGLKEFLNRGDLSVEETKLVLTALGKACRCESMSVNLNEVIVNAVLMSTFLDTTVPRLFHQLGRQGNGDDELVRSCLPLFSELLTRMPTDGWIKVQELTVQLQSVWGRGGMRNDDINKAMLGLIDLLHSSKPPPVMDGDMAEKPAVNGNEPPENFRELPIIPRKAELDGTSEIFLPMNKVEGGFQSLEHYLDCQFRLFRADFILPLKESIEDFQNVGEDTTSGFNIYTDVQIIRPVCSHNGLGYRVAFDVRPLRHVRWDSTRRLLFGSLLCLSSDNFKDNILFATVDKREKELASNGLVDVLFLPDQDIQDISRDTRFSMVESQAYFESYKYILEGMQNLTDRNFCFQTYIVDCNKDVNEPLYLRQNQDFLYDLRPLMENDFEITDNPNVEDRFPSTANIAKDVRVQDISTWPIPELLHLDITQLNALRNALTHEFALIQGPPGTGKTYVGVKILKALLHNSAVWKQGNERAPILVVCYTNHALDQFLEETLQFFKGKLVRVGSRSKSEQIQEHSLRNARKRVRETRSVPSDVHTAKLNTMREMENLKAVIHTTAAKLEVGEREIVHESVLNEFMKERYFPERSDYQHCDIVPWLGIEKELCDIERRGEYLQHQLEERHEELVEDEDEDEENLEDETIDLLLNKLNLRQLEDDMEDDFDIDDTSDRHRTLDADIQSVQKKYTGLDVTNLDSSVGTTFLSKEKKELEKEKKRQKASLKLRLLKRIRSSDRMSQEESYRVGNIWRMKFKDRWRLYRFWVDLLCRQAKGEIRDKEDDYKRLARRCQEILLQEDRHILQNCSIIGMTTTGAARYQPILNEIGPKIIVVEEAAEVLEAHVIGTLSRECEHLILIGDHQQLRPNPTVHKLAKKYNLEISLFERMVRNGLECNTLGWQHRMRPEIADVIRPLYKNLRDHHAVRAYEDIRGISTNVFFINHQHPHKKDEETKSFVNEHEAKYMVELCRYLIKQKLEKHRITILTPYSAQMHYLQSLMPKTYFEGVRVVAVDSYQGEENDIVLLSLVRSGEESSIGFLAADNRICVALSRAKMGLYVIGNFGYITEHSPLMKDICTRAQEIGQLGQNLLLRCQNHPKDHGVEVQDLRDFQRMPEGGCIRPCEHRLPCGHICPRMCHPSNRDHDNIRCTKPCKKRCSDCDNVTCTRKCYEECSPCPVLVKRQLPRCKHVQPVECQEDVLSAQCQEQCDEVLQCGHPCSGKCSQVHPPCKELVEVIMPCEHSIQVECSSKDKTICSKPCEEELKCEHICQGTCGTCYQGRLHQPCTSHCTRFLICGHQCQSTCSECPPCPKLCENRCSHSRCSHDGYGQKCGDPCVPCAEPCQWKCRHYKCTAVCGDMCSRPRCNEGCRKKLSCGHLCIGVCGEPCPSFCRTCDADTVTEVFFGNEDEANALFIQLEDCGHILEVKGLDQYMDGAEDESEDTVVKLKGCPRCQTPIRRNLRYGSVIKQALDEIEKVKRKALGNKDRIKSLNESITRNKNRLDYQQQEEVNRLQDSFPVLSETILCTLNNQVLVFQQLLSLERKVKESKGKFRHKDATYSSLLKQIQDFKTWVMLTRFCYSSQEVDDTKREVEHLNLLKSLIDARNWIDLDDHEVPARVMRELVGVIRRLESPPVLSSQDLEQGQEIMEQVKEYAPASGIGISDEERLMIVEAMGLNSGHWYKCKRGHVYAIGECGRPYEESKCPECGGAIGGAAHALAQDNAWAPEMDNAEQPVWSQERDYLFALELQFGDRH